MGRPSTKKNRFKGAPRRKVKRKATNLKNENSLDEDIEMRALEDIPAQSELQQIDKSCLKNQKCLEKDFEMRVLDDIPVESEQMDNILGGRRIVDIDHLLKQLKLISEHGKPFDCGLNDMIIEKELKSGLASKITLKCTKCKRIEKITTTLNDINYDAVVSTIATGTGFFQLQESLGILNVPSMCSDTYLRKQSIVGEDIMKISKASMKNAVEEEKSIARSMGEVDTDGLPLLTVIADGVWNKRSYRSNYSSLSGAACVVGLYTQKVIYMNVRNKYCRVCESHSSPEDIPEHTCNKDFSGSSTSMESSILVEAFKKSESEYGCRYKRLIADGDSSVFKKIVDCRPYKNLTIEKTECRNHLFRNFRTNLRKILADTSTKITDRKIIGNKTERILYGISTAISHQKTVTNVTLSQKILLLEEDIQNSIHHVLGDHTNCKEYFCSKKEEKNLYLELGPKIKNDVNGLLNRLGRNSKSLLFDQDSNVAERFNSIVAKTVGGKRVNFSVGNSYRYRCHAAVIQHNSGKLGSTVLDEKYQEKMYVNLDNLENTRIKENAERKKRRSKSDDKKYSPKEKASDKDYGSHCEQPDLSPDLYDREIEKHFALLKLNQQNRKEIETETKEQSKCEKWNEIRRNLITASNFGIVCAHRKNGAYKNKIKSILYPKILNTVAIVHGNTFESTAICQLEKQLNIKIEKCGIFIDKEFCYMAASPDGIYEEGIVEIKCPLSAFNTTVDEALKLKKLKFLKIDKDGKIGINKKHKYYYQIQGQLRISNKKKCLFGVWTGTDLPLYVEQIEKDDEFWDTQMSKQIQNFYMQRLLPEIVDPRYTRSMEIRESV